MKVLRIFNSLFSSYEDVDTWYSFFLTVVIFLYDYYSLCSIPPILDDIDWHRLSLSSTLNTLCEALSALSFNWIDVVKDLKIASYSFLGRDDDKTGLRQFTHIPIPFCLFIYKFSSLPLKKLNGVGCDKVSIGNSHTRPTCPI